MLSAGFLYLRIPRGKHIQEVTEIPPAGARHLLQQELRIFAWVHPVGFRGFHNAVDRSAGCHSVQRIADQPVLPAHHERTDGIFIRIIGNRNESVQQETAENLLLAGGIARCLA